MFCITHLNASRQFSLSTMLSWVKLEFLIQVWTPSAAIPVYVSWNFAYENDVKRNRADVKNNTWKINILSLLVVCY
jgi:hypothetical protein